jgi:hypothetical protein
LQVLAELRESWNNLPEQIALEVHFALGGKWTNLFAPSAAKISAQGSMLFSHLANLGYAVVSREDNPDLNTGCCSEFTFLRVEHR